MSEKPKRGAEARQHPRAQARLKVDFHFGTTTGVGYTRDVSEGGIYLAAKRVARQGTRVYLRIHLPDDVSPEPLKVIGVVTRAIQARPLAGGQPAAPDALPPGMGIRFEVAYARTREALARFVSDTLGVPSRGTRSIEAVAGEEEGQAGYVVRFGEAAAGEQPDAPLTAADVGRAFAFRAQIDWGRILSLGWKIGLVALVLLAIVLALIWS